MTTFRGMPTGRRVLSPLMRIALALLTAALLSCRAPIVTPPNQPISASPPPTDLDDNAVKAMSHAFLDAFDRADETAFTSALGGTFGFFEEGHWLGADAAVMNIRQRRERHAPPRSRTYKDEHVKVSNGVAVFVADAVDHFLPDGDRPTGDFEGWNTLVWVRDGDRWKVAHWQWEKAGFDAEREMWNSTYRSGRGFNPNPSAFLVDIVKGRKPGAALDVAMGQGRNAIYLASQGWHVTGFDISEEGLRVARETARGRKLSIDAINAKMEGWDFGAAKWDLVAFIYAADADVLKKAIPSVKPGGLVVVEGFHKDASRRAQAPGFATGEIAAIFKDGFKVLRDDVVEDVTDWGGTRTKLVRFAAERR